LVFYINLNQAIRKAKFIIKWIKGAEQFYVAESKGVLPAHKR
jgi:hypothetical protein